MKFSGFYSKTNALLGGTILGPCEHTEPSRDQPIQAEAIDLDQSPEPTDVNGTKMPQNAEELIF